MKKIISYITLFFAIAIAAMAYPVDVQLNGNMVFSTAVYHCTDASCLVTSPYTSVGGNPVVYSLSWPTAGLQYFAEYDFAGQCTAPESHLVSLDETTSQGPYVRSISFGKVSDCVAPINFVSGPSQMAVGDTGQIQISLESPFLLAFGGPQSVPAELLDIYSQNVTVSLYDNGVLQQTRIVRIASNQNENVFFNYVPSTQGVHTIRVVTDTSNECSCASTSPTIYTTTIVVSNTHLSMQPLGVYTVYELQNVNFSIIATDIYNHALTYSGSPMPPGSNLGGPLGNQFFWTPNITQSGIYNVVFTVNDGTLQASQTATIIVLDIGNNTNNTITQIPDLMLSNLSITQPITQTNNAQISALVTNVANTTAFTFVNFYVDNSVVASIPVTIAPNSAQNVVNTYAANAAGTHTLFASVDPFNLIVESNENNNNQSITFFVNAAATLNATTDLVMSNLVLPPTVAFGSAVPITAYFANVGNTTVNTFVNFYGDGNLMASVPVTIAPNSAQNLSLNTWIPISAGAHSATAIIDPSNLIAETNEANNALTVLFSVNSSGNANGTNIAPIASFTYLPSNTGNAPFAVTFTDTSTDVDGTVVLWSWNFGDGTTSTLQNPTHTFNNPGSYTVRLTVTDNLGAQSSTTVTFIVTANPIIIGSCNDTDGFNVFTQGKVFTPSQTFTDFCVDNTRVYEGYCDINGNLVKSVQWCQYGCLNGACLATNPNPISNAAVGEDANNEKDISLSVKRLHIYGVDNYGFMQDEGLAASTIYAEAWIENIGDVDIKDAMISFSIPDLGIDSKQVVGTIKKGQTITKKLSIKAPIQPGSYDAKVTVWANGVKSSKYRAIQVY